MTVLRKVLKSLSINESKQKNVAVIGWLGAFNLGDEMMLDVTLKELHRRGHKATLLVHKNDDEV